MIRGAAAALALVLGFALAPIARAQEGHPDAPARGAPDVPAGPADVIVQLVHATRPEAVANVDVLLYALSADGHAGLRQGRTDAQGSFRFAGVSNAADVTWLVGARPSEVPFGTRFAFARGERERRVQLEISDPVTDPSGVAAAALELRVERGCTHLRVSQKHEVANRGDRVVFVPPSERATAAPIFEVELPAEADGFEVITGGEGLAHEGRRVRFFGPVYPGEQTIEFGYGLPIATKSFAVGFPTGAPELAVLAPKDLVAVSSDALRAAPERTVDGQRFAAATGRAIAAGGSLALAVATAESAPTPVRTPRAQLWLELDDAALQVDEQIEVVAEPEGTALAASARPLLCVPLPAGAEELRFSTETFGAGLRRDPSGDLAIHGPLPAGTSQLALSYRLPATSSGVSLMKSFDRALPQLSVLVADNGVIAETPRLHRRKSARVGDRNFLHLEAFAVAPAERIALTLRRTPPVSASGRTAPMGFALLAGVAALTFLVRPLRAQSAALDPAEPEVDATDERDAIVRSLEALDEDLETGKLSAEDHAAMRASLRAQAAALLLAPQRQVARSESQASEVDPGSAPEAKPPAFCTACGAAARASDRFCAQCGARLS